MDRTGGAGRAHRRDQGNYQLGGRLHGVDAKVA
jgi:hypothetical protein